MGLASRRRVWDVMALCPLLPRRPANLASRGLHHAPRDAQSLEVI
ncbi:hypothetical protein AH4AK4_0759 [Aeromonas hydrophila 4AK4]|nr:hypothetical protein AH4AK4_0759 [Aeromonas hydrophila 4AK4]